MKAVGQDVGAQVTYWLAIFRVLLQRLLGRALPGVVSVGISVFGMVAIVSPLALWFAWSIAVLQTIIIIGMSAVFLVLFLAWLSPNDRV